MLPMFGYSTLDEYLHDWSPCHRLDGITIPVLAVNASDDPFCPIHSQFSIIYKIMDTVGTQPFVLCREVVPLLEGVEKFVLFSFIRGWPELYVSHCQSSVSHSTVEDTMPHINRSAGLIS